MTPPAHSPSDATAPPWAGLLADLLPVPVVVVANGRPQLANAAALALLDVFALDDIGDAWPSFASQWRVADAADGSARGEADWTASGQPRRLRYEALAADAATTLVLLDEPGRGRDSLMLLANDAIAARPVVAAMVHDARGHANGVTLALAAVSAVLQHAMSGDAAPLLRDQIAVAQRECQALIRSVNAWATLLRPPPEGPIAVDLAPLVAQLPTLLLHPAVEREIACRVEVAPGPLRVDGDPSRLHAAIHGLALHLIERAATGAAFVAHLASDGREHVVLLTVDRLADPDEPVDASIGLAGGDAPASVTREAALRIVEAHHGRVTALATPGRAGFRIDLPARAESAGR